MSQTVYVLVRLEVNDCDKVSVDDIINDMTYEFSYFSHSQFDRIVEIEVIDWNHSGKF